MQQTGHRFNLTDDSVARNVAHPKFKDTTHFREFEPIPLNRRFLAAKPLWHLAAG